MPLWISMFALRPAASDACTICIGFPTKTAVDHVVESDCVVLARQSSDNPFEFATVEVLKGHGDGASFNLLVDTVTRRRLALGPDRKVALLRDPQNGSWRSLGVLSSEYEAVLRRVVLLSSEWADATTQQPRARFFLPFFGHDDAQIRELAYLELGRAPYSLIKQLGRSVSREDLMPMLTRREYIQWRSLAILLLAQNSDSQDRRYILDSFHTAHRLGLSTNLAAWATAAIEIERESTVCFIEDAYFRASGRTSQELEAVVKALSLHGSEGDRQLRDRIVAAYGVLLEHFPTFAVKVAADLRAWESVGLTDRLSNILASNVALDVVDRRSIEQYLHSVTSRSEAFFIHD